MWPNWAHCCEPGLAGVDPNLRHSQATDGFPKAAALRASKCRRGRGRVQQPAVQLATSSFHSMLQRAGQFGFRNYFTMCTFCLRPLVLI